MGFDLGRDRFIYYRWVHFTGTTAFGWLSLARGYLRSDTGSEGKRETRSTGSFIAKKSSGVSSRNNGLLRR